MKFPRHSSARTSAKTIVVSRQGEPLLLQVLHADNFVRRLRGLLGYQQLGPQDGMLLSPCHQVHTIGMSFAIDVVFLDTSGFIIGCVENLMPNRLASKTGAHHTLEIAQGGIERSVILPGQKLSWG
ncbi:MAG: DUF192 domain-containing protein [Burkholderiaceae bacterium]